MNASALEQLLKDHLQKKYGVVLDYFAIEGQMSPDAQGQMGVTGNYRKTSGDKTVFFTATVNVNSRRIENLQEY
jgi:hypothetical protein